MISIEKIVTINASGLGTIPETVADMLIILNRDITVVNGTLPFPLNPIDGQIFTLYTKCQVTNFSTDIGGRAISFVPTTLLANEIVSWIFDTGSNTWFIYNILPRWGKVGGLLSDQADLQAALDTKISTAAAQTALNTKQDVLVAGSVTNAMLAGSIAISKITGYSGYVINVQALTSSPADGQTIFFGMLPKAPVTTGATSKIFIRQSGTIKRAEIYCFSGTAGTNEAWPMSIRLNNTTDTLIASVAAATNERVFTNSLLNIAVVAGDFVEIKCVNPTWATNPLTTIFGGYIYIE